MESLNLEVHTKFFNRENISVPDYDSDLRSAWTIIDKLQEEWQVELYSLQRGWICKLTSKNTLPTFSVNGEPTRLRHTIGNTKVTPALAICYSALETLTVKK